MGSFEIDNMEVAEFKVLKEISPQLNMAMLEEQKEALAKEALAYIDDQEVWDKIWRRYEAVVWKIDFAIKYNLL